MPMLALPSGSLHYRVDGKPGAPWVVLVHALGTDLTLWDRQCSALASDYRVLRYDLRGHGQSDAADGPYTLRELASDLLSLLDALAVEHVHMVGISIGGQIAMAAAAIAPRRVLRLVLANTAGRIASAGVWSDRIEAVQREGIAPLINTALARWFGDAFRAREPDTVAAFGALLSSTRVAGYAGCCAALRDGDLGLLLHSIHAPTLVIAGAHDPVTTPAHGRMLVAGIAGASYLELDAGHLSNVEAAAPFDDALRVFLASATHARRGGRSHG